MTGLCLFEHALALSTSVDYYYSGTALSGTSIFAKLILRIMKLLLSKKVVGSVHSMHPHYIFSFLISTHHFCSNGILLYLLCPLSSLSTLSINAMFCKQTRHYYDSVPAVSVS